MLSLCFAARFSKHMTAFIEDILTRIQDLLELAPPVRKRRRRRRRRPLARPARPPGRQPPPVFGAPQDKALQAALTSDDQLFMFEAAGVLIVSGESPLERKRALMRALLAPLMDAFRLLLDQLPLETDEETQAALADCLSHAVGFVRSGSAPRLSLLSPRNRRPCAVNGALFSDSRTSKAFSNKQTVKQCGCSEVYRDCLRSFLPALSCPVRRGALRGCVRSFLHRMIICMEEEVLPFIPAASEHMLKDCEAKDLQEFIPLISQIATKFKVGNATASSNPSRCADGFWLSIRWLFGPFCFRVLGRRQCEQAY